MLTAYLVIVLHRTIVSLYSAQNVVNDGTCCLAQHHVAQRSVVTLTQCTPCSGFWCMMWLRMMWLNSASFSLSLPPPSPFLFPLSLFLLPSSPPSPSLLIFPFHFCRYIFSLYWSITTMTTIGAHTTAHFLVRCNKTKLNATLRNTM
jgi:hypothetical protein